MLISLKQLRCIGFPTTFPLLSYYLPSTFLLPSQDFPITFPVLSDFLMGQYD